MLQDNWVIATSFVICSDMSYFCVMQKNKNRECNGKWKVNALLIDNLGIFTVSLHTLRR
jgi:hypothetical protein